ncbi:ubiquinone biosynthesis monooxygenase Coq7 [Variovorax boronicumulans]|jgi:ubiquinone biosynthesis monooxygenase Coq7|uniref:demethoxyubiquinone hydroxylase family protein n=1 Tax=Variovorax boronicumulans TaxID=436515 RepID=UPI000785420A|nr:demethoxyubiquinone hydroxylase family protein [Variovorax boronicumulans]MDP9908075.1 ubiquinone biosynthesis monooxygenase Coq7 [Variovorax boronicumulans]
MKTEEASDQGSALGGRILKVDHAGEQGAVNIYRAQIFMARWTAPSLVPELREFKSHEEGHRALFAAELKRRGVRRCRSYWLCGMGGWVLGLITGLLGRHAISATTVAVERVVLGHLKAQLRELAGKDEAAVRTISQIVEEEQLHHDQSASHVQANHLWTRVLSPVVALSTESVIWLGMRL